MAQKISQMTEQTTSSMTEAGTSDFLGGYTATGGNANRKFSLSGLANYFLNKFKMTLGGSSQTVKSAIDALNSNFNGSISKLVSSWSDAVNAAKASNYRSVQVVISGTDSVNLPTGNNTHWGFIYTNPSGTYGGALLQTFHGYTYSRRLFDGVWDSWTTSARNTLTTGKTSGATSFTIPNSYRGKLTTVDSNSDRCGEWYVWGFGSGVVAYKNISPASAVSLSTAQNQLTVTVSDAGTPVIFFENMQGVVSMS